MTAKSLRRVRDGIKQWLVGTGLTVYSLEAYYCLVGGTCPKFCICLNVFLVQVLKSWMELGYRPAYVIYERLHQPRGLDFASLLKPYGYTEIAQKGWNAIYEHQTPEMHSVTWQIISQLISYWSILFRVESEMEDWFMSKVVPLYPVHHAPSYELNLTLLAPVFMRLTFLNIYSWDAGHLTNQQHAPRIQA